LNDAINLENGGDSFCFLESSQISDKAASKLGVVSQGKYPLYGIRMRATDIRLLPTLKDSRDADVLTLPPFDLSPARTSLFFPMTIPFAIPGDYQAFNVFFVGKNGMWTEMLRMQKVNGQWEQAIIVAGDVDHHHPKGALLMRSVSAGFPLKVLANEPGWVAYEKLPATFRQPL
jgi:hypothetical protein